MLAGTGGDDFTPGLLRAARQQTPQWEWTVMGRGPGGRQPDPLTVIAGSDVVVTHAGQDVVAAVASARRPAVVLPQPRPYEEQDTTAAVLRQGFPAVVVDGVPLQGWAGLLDAAHALDADAWRGWCDGSAAARLTRVVEDVARRTSPSGHDRR